ncbi:hypothetical protein L218DRAFT_491097 [Marasmius fiardii PR-910]|nr:hypothetical protein L218DRAFT_491097 [Marasmius fiardii PR-910]
MIASNQTIPFYAGQNPDQWMGQSFNVPEAKLITAENNPDLTGAPSQKKTTSIGAIVGGTVGGVLLLVLVSLLLFYTCRRRRASRTLQGISSRGLGYFALPGSPPFSTSTTPTMHTFSRLSTPSMYAFSVAQTPPLHQHYSMVGSPSITQIVRPEPPTSHIEPFMLTSPGESPETVACRRKKAPARGAPQSRSQTVPTTAVVSPGQQTTPGHVHRLQGVEEAEDGPQPRVPRGRSESQPPAYDSLLLETIEVAAALRERSGHSHRPHGASPENGSQDSQTSWVSFGGVSGSTNSPPVSIVVRGQQPRNVDELLAPRAGPSCDTRYRSVQSSANGDHPDVEVA